MKINENMLRFGTKNLTNEQKRQIRRLTEADTNTVGGLLMHNVEYLLSSLERGIGYIENPDVQRAFSDIHSQLQSTIDSYADALTTKFANNVEGLPKKFGDDRIIFPYQEPFGQDKPSEPFGQDKPR